MVKRRNKLLLYSHAFHPIDKLVETGIFKNINILIIIRLTHLTFKTQRQTIMRFLSPIIHHKVRRNRDTQTSIF